jgi:uncharacterized protein YciI
MIIAHVAVTTADDYVTRRAAYREAHLGRLMDLRARGFVVGGGPAPDGRSADIVYRAPDEAAVRRLVDEDPYMTGGAWTGYTVAPFSEFLEPWRLPSLVTDGSRRVTIAEGRVTDPDLAPLALVEARGAGRLVFGGLFPGGGTLAVMAEPQPDEALRWFAETGFWAPDSLRARPLLYVL